MNNDSIKKTILVSIVLCIVCSILVSGSAVLLKDQQQRNKAIDKRKNILVTAGLVEKNANPSEIDQAYNTFIQPALYDFSKQSFTSDVPANYDQRKAAKDKTQNKIIENDYARIKTRAQNGLVYFVKKDGAIDQIILPIHGKGLWSTLYGFISVKKDLNTIQGLSFYEHGETPGLGGEVDNPKWKSLWQGKLIYGEDGQVQIQVIKGSVDPQTPGANYKVDGLSGATLTSRGVSNMLKYWFGDDAYGPFLKQINLNTLEQTVLSQNTQTTLNQGENLHVN